jgi:peptide methionine sulfoxide reductase msrA/msrB
MILKWLDVLKFINNGNPAPDQRVEKSEQEWEQLLTEEQFYITRKKGTEPAHSSELCNLFEPGKYACVCCHTPLFDSSEKYQSRTGWPSFTQPIKANAIAYHKDTSYGMYRVEVTCNTCDAHLGHVFPDGPAPSGLRYCINALALEKIYSEERKAVFGGGCFWCTEAVFQQLKGVTKVVSGYSGGTTVNPTYREVSSGKTGHAEVIEVTYIPSEISYEELIKIHLSTHNPTTVNQQGADKGSQYRSIIFYKTEEEKTTALKAIDEIQAHLDAKIVTEVVPYQQFYQAEEYHQNYYNKNPEGGYCLNVIDPKLKKFRELFKDNLKV